MQTLESLIANPQLFWARFNVQGNGCWIFKGKARRGSLGYGAITMRNSDGSRYVDSAHRLAYLVSGGELSEGELVRHSCDTPLCGNPAHLISGSQQNNIDDSIERMRARNGNIKLTGVEQIGQIKADCMTMTITAVGKKHGLSRRQIGRIFRGECWKPEYIGRALATGDIS